MENKHVPILTLKKPRAETHSLRTAMFSRKAMRQLARLAASPKQPGIRKDNRNTTDAYAA